MLSNVEEPYLIQLFIEGTHRSQYMPAAPEQVSKRINLSLESRDKAIAARRAHRSTRAEIALRILEPYNNTNESQLNYAHKNSKDLCTQQQLKRLVERDDNWLRDNVGPWTILDQLVNDKLKNQGKILYYQCNDTSASENNPEHYYQLIVSDEMWLQQGRNCGYFCFGVDRKYDLNNEKAPVLAIVIEDQAGYGSPLAFGLSNKENHHTIKMAVQAVQANIPCNDSNCTHQYQYINLENGKGFRRQHECATFWNPLAIIDKHRPTKLALQGLIRGTVLCWFHIMATLGEHLQVWKPSRFSNCNEPFDETTNRESIEEPKISDNTIMMTYNLADSTQYLQDCDSSINDDNIEAGHCDTFNMNALEDSDNTSFSIYRRNTTRIRNKRQVSGNEKENDATLAIKRSLEELFLEKECNWNPKEFTNVAVAKRLCLDNNPVENGVKLYRWISNRKIRAKNA
ncbi:33376_t:CDS:2 [Gigaspora margarita]|uniref:33376_t:CDS:1 n=1 Tax=Gigaspora margarita TaxID=4874 RepID=A0ABM8VWV3_GIGMA|nr:33376_t:CDS:2 [Gigaspora margarita]